MHSQALHKWFEKKRSTALPGKDRSALRVGIPRVLNVWSTHQFWIGFLLALGISQENVIFSSQTSEEQFREYGKGRGSVDCCYPVKCVSGHYGELLFGLKNKINVLLSPMIYSLPSFLHGNVVDTLSCTRVMASPENIKAGFVKERDLFRENNIVYVSPFVSLGDSEDTVAGQMFQHLRDTFDLDWAETREAVKTGFAALWAFDQKMRQKTKSILQDCAHEERGCILLLARPYHVDTGIGHEIEAELQAYGYPILSWQHLPLEGDILDWLFGEDVRAGKIRNPLDVSDVWPSSYSSNTNEIIWGAKFAARCPWIGCVIHLSSYECGMDQPIYTPVQKIIEASRTLFFKFGDLDANKPTGSIRIRVETIVHYLQKYSHEILRFKLDSLPQPVPPGFEGPRHLELTKVHETSNANTLMEGR